MNYKKPLTFALGLLAGASFAQSSLTVFGVVDNAIRNSHSTGAGSVTTLASGAYSSSRYGIRGREDLGGGLAASFWLESFLSADSGTVSPAGFQRRSTVSLSDRSYGELRMGRDYTPSHSNWARFDPFGYVGLGSVQLFSLAARGNTPVTAAFGTAPNTVQRIKNSVQYLLPSNSWGLEGGLMYAFGERGAAADNLHKGMGGRLGVKFDNVFISAAHMRTRNALTQLGAFKDSALAASWDASFARFTAGIRRLQYADAQQNNYLLSARVPFGAQEVKFSWNRADARGRAGGVAISANDADQFALGYVYHLSKRTRAYTTVAMLRNKGAAAYAVPGAPVVQPGGRSRGIELGLNHEF
ncbi:porin [Pantoea sp. 18069]|uniref:porin n=1 Tax=Pantoea sp. 18069 TaxID=2681415 RepID=UPI0013593685|nr:porin [Pantoea sp. 18069]